MFMFLHDRFKEYDIRNENARDTREINRSNEHNGTNFNHKIQLKNNDPKDVDDKYDEEDDALQRFYENYEHDEEEEEKEEDEDEKYKYYLSDDENDENDNDQKNTRCCFGFLPF
ncbi:hypothetical protein YYG_05160 [Plasmodium vinckei petteri]|uniref:PYST-C1-like N-terminal domain-containing protein n=1 Tax=Plasmodium vinckei petteri TaxID=138298 RepID=W7AW45_PLAVN|nr:hypothetical protein YYG_05160 [Plasmodium vinckei petteri]